MYVQLIANILVTSCLYFVIAASFYFIFASTKTFHLAHASVISGGAYLTLYSVQKLTLTLWPSMLLGIGGSIVVGLAYELLVYRSMRRRQAAPFTFLISSIGLYIITYNCFSLWFGDSPKIIASGPVHLANNILGAYLTTVQLAIVATSVGLFIGIHIFMRFSSFARLIKAVSVNPTLCDIYGISSDRVIAWCFIIGSALGAVAGILSGLNSDFTPTSGFDLLLYGIIAMILGGLDGFRGLALGAVLLAGAQQLITFYVDKMWMDTIVYLVLILFLLWKPLGLSGVRLKKIEI
jgi:branched-chain amino acid transport system permease protein